MNRKDRRADREPGGGRTPHTWSGLGQPAQGRLQTAKRFAPGDESRQRQDFLAGTVFAAGAGVAFPEDGPGGPAPLGPLFTVYVHEDERTFGPAPQLREAFALLDEHGSVKMHDLMDVGTAWAGLGGEEPLVKLKLEFHGPSRGSTGLVLLADQHAEIWQYIVGGGLLAITSQPRIQDVMNRQPGASFAQAMEASILLGVGTSPVLEQMIDAYGWARP
ncbi:hypothetical protein QMK19_25965 [Streptomyces sp. H10-C2]|uniref:hypothetical protein n=1 Tax=unclassified Streptomyces TaxID=2593676 RepID=UPI0024BAF195|nr:MULTISPECIES: hypothetical protein [unclassified Streptomyces]MDJ0345643.1 hypothetical protein [Streptomyces sp. PH10-H1]MDJ0373008.1 hypothetical protein [Streptomyces sp. H10-C2]